MDKFKKLFLCKSLVEAKIAFLGILFPQKNFPGTSNRELGQKRSDALVNNHRGENHRP